MSTPLTRKRVAATRYKNIKYILILDVEYIYIYRKKEREKGEKMEKELKNYVCQYVNESNKFVVQQIVFDLIDSIYNTRKEKKREIALVNNCLMKLPRLSIA